MKTLEEAAWEYVRNKYTGSPQDTPHHIKKMMIEEFIAGAAFMKEQFEGKIPEFEAHTPIERLEFQLESARGEGWEDESLRTY